MTLTPTTRRRVLGALIGAGLCTVTGVHTAQAVAQRSITKRHALVIGNASYAIPANTLANPVQDARLIAQALRSRGFEVTLLTDLTTRQMEQAVDDFSQRAEGADLTLVYFAGHAVAMDDVNYLFGVDLALPLKDVRIDNAQLSSLSMRRVSLALRRAKVPARLLVLDACRTNLTRGAAAAGLTNTVPAGGELIAFSTQPGATAEDGFGAGGPRNSPYAFFFAEALASLPASAPVEVFFKQLTGDVQVATSYRQVPHYASSLVGEVTFVSLTDAQTPAVPGSSTAQATQPGRGPSPTLGQDLIRARMSAWEYEIERGAKYLDEPRYEALRERGAVGDVVAITTLGLIAENGEHVPKDYKQAAIWYQQAADQDFAPAQTYLGELAAMGRGIPKNYALAERMFRKAAQAGHSRASLNLIDVRSRMGEPIEPTDLGSVMRDLIMNSGDPRPSVF